MLALELEPLYAALAKERQRGGQGGVLLVPHEGTSKGKTRDQLAKIAKVSEVVLDAEVKLGELIAAMPTATKGNQYTGKMVSNNAVTNQIPKEQALREIGFDKMQASRLETLAKHPEVVA